MTSLNRNNNPAKMMLPVVASMMIFLSSCLGDGESNSIYYCSDLNPQPHVNIDQLMGMWYGIEVITHNMDAKHEIAYEEGCLLLHLSEDNTPITYPPLHRDYNYQKNYGSGYGRGYHDRGYDSNNNYDDENNYYTTQTTTYEYETYQRTGYHRSRYGEYNRRRQDMKRLRLMWDEKGVITEYTMRYNVSKAGFWISSGPQNGSQLEPKFDGFAGTIQVLKVVGSHMVLVFCRQLPDQQLYSVLLSRVQNLSQSEIHGVHNLLNRRGLSTTSIRKVCFHDHNDAGTLIANTIIAFLFAGLLRCI